jgi:predicted RNase H-like HicB family nuclease
MSNSPQTYNITDGELVLTLEMAEEGGFTITSPMEPELITEADSIPEAFAMARDALQLIRECRKEDAARLEKAS